MVEGFMGTRDLETVGIVKSLKNFVVRIGSAKEGGIIRRSAGKSGAVAD